MKYGLKTKITFIVMAVWLTMVPSLALSDDSLPPLPTAPIIEDVEVQDAQTSKSLWQKFKDFIGIGSSEDKSIESADKGEEQDDMEFVSTDMDDIAEEFDVTTQDVDNIDDVPDQLILPEDFVQEIEVERKQEDADRAPKIVSIQNSAPSFQTPQEKEMSEKVIMEPRYASESASNEDLKKLDDEYSIPSLDEGPSNELTVSPVPSVKVQSELNAKKSDSVRSTSQGDIMQDGNSTTDMSGKSAAELAVNQQQVSDEAAEVKVKPEDITLSYVPNYGNNSSNNQKSAVMQPQSQPQTQERVAKSELPDTNTKTPKNEMRLDQEEQKLAAHFAADELQVLLLPDDEVVLGQLTQKAKLKQMPFMDYVKIFWQEYGKVSRLHVREQIEEFINNYDENFN